MDKPDFSQKCYQTADDKRHNTIWGVQNLVKETPEEREERLKNLRESRGTWVYDETKNCMVRKEEYVPPKKEIDMPQISLWNPEFTVVGTGRRMSKGQLKEYCRTHGKILEN